MLNLLFSFKGRIGRLKYFVTSFIVGTIYITYLVSAIIGPFVDPSTPLASVQEHVTAIFNVIFSPMSLTLTAIGVWIQLALVWKRTRDMNQSMTFAYVYVACPILGCIPFIGIVFLLIQPIMVLVLTFKPSKDTAGHAPNPELFGSSTTTASTSNAEFGTDMQEQDLIARAAQLRESEQQMLKKQQPAPANNAPVRSQPGRTAPRAFGNRSRSQVPAS